MMMSTMRASFITTINITITTYYINNIITTAATPRMISSTLLWSSTLRLSPHSPWLGLWGGMSWCVWLVSGFCRTKATRKMTHLKRLGVLWVLRMSVTSVRREVTQVEGSVAVTVLLVLLLCFYSDLSFFLPFFFLIVRVNMWAILLLFFLLLVFSMQDPKKSIITDFFSFFQSFSLFLFLYFL